MATIKRTGLNTLQALVDEIEARYARIDDVSVYSIEKKATADEGYIASYNLTKDGTVVGDTINIPKDYLVKSATVKTVDTADTPVEGYNVGDKYIDFVINTIDDDGNESHIYIAFTDLNIATYTAGDGIDITNSEVSAKVDTTNGMTLNESGIGINLATTNTAGAMSAADKTKLDSAITEVTTSVTGTGNVITSMTSVDGAITAEKGITALVESDFEEITSDEVQALFTD